VNPGPPLFNRLRESTPEFPSHGARPQPQLLVNYPHRDWMLARRNGRIAQVEEVIDGERRNRGLESRKRFS
jgi:hypothetical protein